jgi:hypothetical protein
MRWGFVVNGALVWFSARRLGLGCARLVVACVIVALHSGEVLRVVLCFVARAGSALRYLSLSLFFLFLFSSALGLFFFKKLYNACSHRSMFTFFFFLLSVFFFFFFFFFFFGVDFDIPSTHCARSPVDLCFALSPPTRRDITNAGDAIVFNGILSPRKILAAFVSSFFLFLCFFFFLFFLFRL